MCNTQLIKEKFNQKSPDNETCAKYVKQNCSDGAKFDENCKILAYEKMLTESIKKSCVAHWGMWSPILTVGNNKSAIWDDIWYPWVNVATVVVLWFMIQGFAIYYFTKEIEYDSNHITPKDYTVLVKGLPRHKTDFNFNVKENLQKLIEDQGYHVVQINMVYDPEQYHVYKSKVQNAKRALSKHFYGISGKVGMVLLNKLDNELTDEEALEKIKELTDEITVNKAMLKRQEDFYDGRLYDKFHGQAFVSFNFEKEATKFAELYKKRGFCHDLLNLGTFGFYQRDKLTLEYNGDKYDINSNYASEPGDVIWEFHGHDHNTLFFRRIVAKFML